MRADSTGATSNAALLAWSYEKFADALVAQKELEPSCLLEVADMQLQLTDSSGGILRCMFQRGSWYVDKPKIF